MGTHSEMALRWMPKKLTNEKWTLVQVMAWFHQATSHYLSQFWSRFILPHAITRPQWVNTPPVTQTWANIKVMWFCKELRFEKKKKKEQQNHNLMEYTGTIPLRWKARKNNAFVADISTGSDPRYWCGGLPIATNSSMATVAMVSSWESCPAISWRCGNKQGSRLCLKQQRV